MGAEPAFALAFVGWPTDDLPDELLAEVMRGGAEKIIEAGAVLLGGHSIKDVEPKYGLAVTGFAHPDAVLTNAGARAGDLLVLTKPLGSGVLAHAIKHQQIDPDAERRVITLMATLNRGAAAAARAIGVDAATDVTGFGFLGHLSELCRASGVAAEIDIGAVPTLPEAAALIARNVVPGGSKKNLRYVAPLCLFGDGVTPAEQLLLADAQTSGGLLLAVPAGRAQALLTALAAPAAPCAAVVGRLAPQVKGGPLITVRR
jgi:selenide,water dikinase